MPLLASFLSPSFAEMALIGLIALLLYGSDLPHVIRSWGKTYNELRRNLHGIRNELNDAIYAEPDPPRKLQYYPEFQHQTTDDGASDAAPEAVVDVAPPAEAAAGDDASRHDTHGAA